MNTTKTEKKEFRRSLFNGRLSHKHTKREPSAKLIKQILFNKCNDLMINLINHGSCADLELAYRSLYEIIHKTPCTKRMIFISTKENDKIEVVSTIFEKGSEMCFL